MQVDFILDSQLPTFQLAKGFVANTVAPKLNAVVCRNLSHAVGVERVGEHIDRVCAGKTGYRFRACPFTGGK